MGSVATSPVSHQTTRSRGVSSQAQAASRPASWSASQATWPPPTRRRAGCRSGPRRRPGRRRPRPVAPPRPPPAGPTRRWPGPSGPRRRRPARSVWRAPVQPDGVDRAEPAAGLRPGPRRRPPPPTPTTSDGSCSDRPGAGWAVVDRGARPGPPGPSSSHRTTLVTLVPRSRVRITGRARARPARSAMAAGTASWRMARPMARPAPPPAMTSRASSRTRSGPHGRWGPPRKRTGTPTLATTRATASTRAPRRGRRAPAP